MKVIIRSSNGDAWIEVDGESSINELMIKIEEKFGIEPINQSIIVEEDEGGTAAFVFGYSTTMLPATCTPSTYTYGTISSKCNRSSITCCHTMCLFQWVNMHFLLLVWSLNVLQNSALRNRFFFPTTCPPAVVVTGQLLFDVFIVSKTCVFFIFLWSTIITW